MIVAGVYSDYFADLYAEARLSPSSALSLFTTGGDVLVEFTPPSAPDHSAPSFSDLGERLSVSPSSTFVLEDGDGRIIAYRRLANVPVAIAVSTPIAVALSEWRQRAWRSGALALSTTAGFGLLTMLGISLARRESAALQASEERHRSLVLATSSIVWTTNAQGEFAEAQPSWEAYTGQPWDKHRGLGWIEMIHPDDRAAVLEDWDEARATRTVYETTGRLWHAATQSHRHYASRAAPVLAADGSVREWIGTCTDVEDRWRADEALRESEERQSVSVEAAELGTWYVNLATGVVGWSERLVGMLGLAPERRKSPSRGGTASSIRTTDRACWQSTTPISPAGRPT